METLLKLGGLLSPSFFAALAGLSLVAAALLFIAGKRNSTQPQPEGAKLSELEPAEYRGSGYLILAFGWSIFGLVLGFIFGAVGTRFSGSLVLVILSLFCLLFALCFLYAGGGTLLRAVTGQIGGARRWVFAFMEPIDAVIILFGDLLTTGLFKPIKYPSIVTKISPDGQVERASTTADSKEAKALKEMEELLHRKIAKYETTLTPEQKEKFEEERRVIDEMRGG
ncbi:MAG: hypothetical protein SU899_03920 [Chloroflexota bacterium]|nr:hypothetical protein [Chloroflexota bacterium]